MEKFRKESTKKKTTTNQFEVLVRELEANPDLARGAPVYGEDRKSMDASWQKIPAKVNSYGPPERNVTEWKKIWADLKTRTKKKLAENSRNLQGTGGGPFEASPLTDMEQAIDRVLFMAKAAAPSGKVLGFAKRKPQPTAAQPKSTETLPIATHPETTASQMSSPQTIGRKPMACHAATQCATNKTPTRRTEADFADRNRLDITPTRTAQNIGMVTPTRISPITPRPVDTHVSPEIASVPRYVPRKRNFQEVIGESAREQATAAKMQAQAFKDIAASSKMQAEATKAFSEALVEMVAVTRRQTEAFEEFINLMKNT